MIFMIFKKMNNIDGEKKLCYICTDNIKYADSYHIIYIMCFYRTILRNRWSFAI